MAQNTTKTGPLKRANQITKTDNGICRSGEANFVQGEDRIDSWPEQLRLFTPKRYSITPNTVLPESVQRVEEDMGDPHPHPIVLIEEWNDARANSWKAIESAPHSLIKWLKKVNPPVALNIIDIINAVKSDSTQQSPFTRKSLKKALNTPIEITLHQGYVHGALTQRRVRQRGFICWRYARKDGLRGIDSAPFLPPEEQPLDIQLHILKWSWKHRPSAVPRCLRAMGLLKEDVRQCTLQYSSHPAISKLDLQRILGTAPGLVSNRLAGRAIERARGLNLGGEAIEIHCQPSVSRQKDPAFFLPRRRVTTDLFSKWHQGIQVDDEGRYSLTPESAALKLASSISHSIVIDAFCGCGGNAIAFARQPHIDTVITVECNPERLAMARHNAQIYGVSKKIKFIEGDFWKLKFKEPFVFADPPWAEGHDYLLKMVECLPLQFKHGVIKLPIDFPFPTDAIITIQLTKEYYPSFALLYF